MTTDYTQYKVHFNSIKVGLAQIHRRSREQFALSAAHCPDNKEVKESTCGWCKHKTNIGAVIPVVCDLYNCPYINGESG